MTPNPTVIKEYWLTLNPDIIFCQPNKAYYGSYLLRVDLDIVGASMRYWQYDIPLKERIANPTYNDFMMFLKRSLLKWQMREITHTVDGRYIHVTKTGNALSWKAEPTGSIKIYDAKVLYNLYTLLRNKPNNVKLARQSDSLRVYANHEDDIINVIRQLEVENSDIRLLSYPDAKQVGTLLSGKEYNSKATDFGYKVFLKPAGKEGMLDLANYLDSIKNTGDVEVPRHCRLAMSGDFDRWSWAHFQRSYMYVRDEKTILLIQLLAGNKFSNYIELAVPDED